MKYQHLLSLSAGNESKGAHSAVLKKIPKMPPVPKPHHMGMGGATVTLAGEHPWDTGDHPGHPMGDTVGSELGPSHPCPHENPFRSPVTAALTWSWGSGEDIQGKRMVSRPGIRVTPKSRGVNKPPIPSTFCFLHSQGRCCIISKTAEKGNHQNLVQRPLPTEICH